MEQIDLYEGLVNTGLPVAYHHYKNPPPLPYIIYFFKDSENFGADNKVYSKSENYLVELYSTKKDREAEAKIELFFCGADIFYDKYETFIASEKLYQVAYEVNI